MFRNNETHIILYQNEEIEGEHWQNDQRECPRADANGQQSGEHHGKALHKVANVHRENAAGRRTFSYSNSFKRILVILLIEKAVLHFSNANFSVLRQFAEIANKKCE